MYDEHNIIVSPYYYTLKTSIYDTCTDGTWRGRKCWKMVKRYIKCWIIEGSSELNSGLALFGSWSTIDDNMEPRRIHSFLFFDFEQFIISMEEVDIVLVNLSSNTILCYKIFK